MREKSNDVLTAMMSVFVLSGMTAVAFLAAEHEEPTTLDPVTTSAANTMAGATQPTGAEWLAEMRPYCNPVDVETRLRWHPSPETMDGLKHRSACLALAGHIEEARLALLDLPEEERWKGAGVVFDIGHPAADAGDDVAAGPLMELVVEFWPNHYMALYHAGAARFQSGDGSEARAYLESFLEYYATEDGWHRDAVSMLAEIGEG